MLGFPVVFYDGKTSTPHQGYVNLLGDQICVACGDQRWSFSSQQVLSATRVSGTNGTVQFRDGESLAFLDGKDFDAFWKNKSASFQSSRWITELETKWKWVLGLSATLTVGLVLVYLYILPLALEPLAKAFPAAWTQRISEQALQALEKAELFERTLSPEGTELAHEAFRIVEAQTDLDLKLMIVRSPMENAFALPDGTILVTMSLLEKVEHPDEILAVLLHEAAHVHFQHGLQSLLQQGILAAVITVAMGSAEVGSLVLIALQSGYSRDFEREADGFSRERMLSLGRDPKHLTNLLKRLQDDASPRSFSWLSSHPSTEEREEQLQSPTEGTP